jgi:two-component system chemotaxis sensor kinase CheA
MAVRKRRTGKAPGAAIPAVTLDDVLALLFQLQPDKIEEFRRFSDALGSLSASGSLDQNMSRLVSAAKHNVDQLIQGETSDAEDVLVEISKLLEAASSAREAAVFCSPSNAPQESTVPDVAKAGYPGGSGIMIPNSSAESASSGPGSTTLPAESLPADADADLLGDFVAESRELLEKSESALLELEGNPDDAEAVNTVFRAFHTVKGTSGFLGLELISELAHLAESLLSRIRNKEIRLTGGFADLALQSLDMLKKSVASVDDALRGAPLKMPTGNEELKSILADPEAAGITEELSGEIFASRSGGKLQSDHLEEKLAEPGRSCSCATETEATGKKLKVSQRGAEFESSIRVNTIRLDRLVDIVGELVIAQSMIIQDRRLHKEDCQELLQKVTHAGKIVRELQDLSMSLRMIPLRGTFQKMQRAARDLARKSGKSVELITDDGETEIDRRMVDILNDILVHMVRNAIDHGIETPDEREMSGKSPTGMVRLTAFHSGGAVVVEIQDDGRGLNRESILHKAIATGLVDPDKSLSDDEVFNLIFAPGLSTSESVTDVSGRGVGMDIVRQGVEALHGRLDIRTAPGEGSAFTVWLPLTLAITDGMLVRVGSERYIIPTVSIHLFRATPDSLWAVSGWGELVLLRGEVMPVLRLNRFFGIDSAVEDPSLGLLVVVGNETKRCALLVDELLGQHQVVAKSLAHAVGKIRGVSGGAILGDGQVGLILDPGEMMEQAGQGSGLYDGIEPRGRSATLSGC